MQHFQCLPGCNFLKPLTLKGIHFAFNPRFKCSSQRNKNRSHGFVFCSATRTGNPRDPNPEIRAKSFARTLGHFTRDGSAHRPVSRKCFNPNAEKFSFHRVTVSHHSAGKNH